MAQRDNPLGPVRRQQVGVLFVDIIGFVGMTETLTPERTVALLRSFHRRMAKTIFERGGSIENFAGDSLMALFGVPSATELDAANTLQCAIAMIDELARWNAKRIKAGRSPIKVAVSANYGTAVLGDIGTRESMTFTDDRRHVEHRKQNAGTLPKPRFTTGRDPIIGSAGQRRMRRQIANLVTLIRWRSAPVAGCFAAGSGVEVRLRLSPSRHWGCCAHLSTGAGRPAVSIPWQL